MNNSRIIGNNILIELQKQSMPLSDFALRIGYSTRDVNKLIEGRLFVPPFQLGKIAETLQVKKDELFKNQGSEVYNGMIHNFGKFEHPENQELVLNLIDMYVDLEEALVQE